VRRLSTFVALTLLVACGANPQPQRGVRVQPPARLNAADNRALTGKRVFFSHQSVGENIVEGIMRLIQERPDLPLTIMSLDQSREAAGPFFAHARLGRNGDPAAKTDAFAAAMDEGLADRIDIGFHKYCYVDVTADTDVQRLFDHYRDTMAAMRARHPRVRFVHVTLPLTEVQSGPKALLKIWLGRAPYGYLDNLRRERFNEMMRQAYAGREPVFDLATVEATRPGGAVESISFRGVAGAALVRDYTSDGGHLNDAGARHVAEALLAFLGDLASGH
jgi:hypothetical protein